MKDFGSWALALVVLVSVGCGKESGDPKKGGPPLKEGPGGQASPDAAMDALLKAIKDENTKAYKECWSNNPREINETDTMLRVMEKAETPEALEAGYKNLFKFRNEDMWAEGKHKRYPAETAGDKASITTVHTSDRYARYDFQISKGWGKVVPDQQGRAEQEGRGRKIPLDPAGEMKPCRLAASRR